MKEAVEGNVVESCVKAVEIVKGDTLWGLSRKYGVCLCLLEFCCFCWITSLMLSSLCVGNGVCRYPLRQSRRLMGLQLIPSMLGRSLISLS